MRIDAHFHLIERISPFCGRGEGRGLGDGRVEFATGEVIRFIPERFNADCFTAEMGMALMDEFGIDMGVVLQSGYYGFQNSYTMQMAREYPDRFYPVGGLDPYCKQSERILNHLIDDLGFRALKFEISEAAGISGYHPGFSIEGPEMGAVFDRANDVGMTMAFDVGGANQGSYQIEGFARMIRRYPKVRFVMCHLLCPRGPGQAGWEQDMLALCADNVWFDIASLPSFINEKAPYAASISYVRKALRLAGEGRLVWGSDAPLILNRYPYEDLLGYFQGSLPAGAVEGMLGGNAIEAYAIPKR